MPRAKPQPTDDRIVLIIEDGPNDKSGGCRQLEYSCIFKQTKKGPKLVIDAVRDAVTMQPIMDKRELPHPAVVMAAAQLYNWHWSNQEVFTEGRVMRPLPFAVDRPDADLPPSVH